MLQISYSGRDSASPTFRCLRRHHQTGSAACVTCSGKAVDDAVSQQVLQAIAPQAIDAAIAAAQRAGERHREQRQALQLELDQARYDAQLAARRYEHVDPAQRLVAAALETRWNAALERVHEQEARMAAFEARMTPRSRSMPARCRHSHRICPRSGTTPQPTCASNSASSGS